VRAFIGGLPYADHCHPGFHAASSTITV
jgi:hypothetical protein